MRSTFRERSLGTSARDQAYVALREAIVGAELEPGRRLSRERARRADRRQPHAGARRARAAARRAARRDRPAARHVRHLHRRAGRSPTRTSSARRWRSARSGSRRATRRRRAAWPRCSANLEAAGARGRRRRRRDASPVSTTSCTALLCDLSGRAVAWRLSERTRGQLDRVRLLSLPEAGYRGQMLAEHRAVVGARSPTTTPDARRARAAPPPADGPVRLPAIRETHPEYFQED